MPSPRVTPHQIRPTDPYLRWMVAADQVQDIADQGSNVAWRHEVPWTTKGWVTSRGEDPEVVADLVRRLHEVQTLGGYTVPQAAAEAVADHIDGADPKDWCWWIRATTPEQSGGVSVLSEDDPRINRLLEHSASAYMLAGDERVHRWFGLEASGELVGVGGAVVETSGAWHLVSVCTDPGQRGRGVARDVCRGIVAEANREGASVVVLEMYSDNEAARRTYGSLGFREEARFRSCVLEPGLSVPA
jgi:ribosomal protein S18 acetylase RimI-like enzyme